MTEMPAAVLRGRGELAVESRPAPPLGADDVLVEVSYCGVCGSDIHMTLEGWGRPGSVGGHEWTGVVAATGADVWRWRVGDEVVGGPTRRCGTCGPCLAGRPSLCEDRNTPGVAEEHGAFARYIRSHQEELLPLPTGLGFREAALTEPLAVALHGITLSRIAPRETALVIGAGPIGQLVLTALLARGWTDVGVIEPTPARQDLAGALGASSVRHPDDVDLPSIAEPDRIVERCGRRRVRVLRASRRDGGRARTVAPRRAPGAGRSGYRSAAIRSEPDPVERAVDHGFVHLRRRRLRPSTRPPGLGRRCPSTSCSSRVRSHWPTCSARCNASLPARSRPRSSSRRARTTHLREVVMADRPRPPRFNHVAMSVPAELLDERHRG